MDHDGWLKAMSHLSSTCFSSPPNTQVIFYDGHIRNFDERALKIIWVHQTQYFILIAVDSVQDNPDDNGPQLNLRNVYVNARMN